jgi:hypothetical protein
MAKLVVYDPSKTGAGLSKRQVEVQFLVLDAFEWVGDSPRGQIGFTLNSTQMGFDVSDVTDPWVGTCLDIMRRARELAMGDDLPG